MFRHGATSVWFPSFGHISSLAGRAPRRASAASPEAGLGYLDWASHAEEYKTRAWTWQGWCGAGRTASGCGCGAGWDRMGPGWGGQVHLLQMSSAVLHQVVHHLSMDVGGPHIPHLCVQAEPCLLWFSSRKTVTVFLSCLEQSFL